MFSGHMPTVLEEVDYTGQQETEPLFTNYKQTNLVEMGDDEE